MWRERNIWAVGFGVTLVRVATRRNNGVVVSVGKLREVDCGDCLLGIWR